MTNKEIDNIKKSNYNELWDNLWNKKNEKFDKKI